MAASVLTSPRHPVSAVVDALQSQVDDLAEVPLWSMGPAEAGDTLLALTCLSASIDELELRVAGHAEAVEVGEATGDSSTANWWAHATRQTRSAAHRKLLAAALDRHPPVREALSCGRLLVDQATVIVEAVEAIPTDLVEAETIRLAEATLVRDAGEHDAKALKILGRRILDVVAGTGRSARRSGTSSESLALRRARWTTRRHPRGRLPGPPVDAYARGGRRGEGQA